MQIAIAATLAVGLTAAASMAFAADGEWIVDDRGQTLIAPFANAPFPHPSRANGHEYDDKLFPAAQHYSDSTVALFIPKGWRDSASVDLLYYFHGWDNEVAQSLQEMALRETLVASGKNVILVFPQGPKKSSDSSCGKLEDPDGIKKLTMEVIERLRADGKTTATAPGRIVLSGHSGAYRVIGKSLKHGGLEDHVAEVYLLDATYGELDNFAAWTQRHPDGKLRSIFTEHLATENVELMAKLDAAGTSFRLGIDGEEANDGLFAAPRVFLYTTKRDHVACRELLGPWLKASGLDDVVAKEKPKP